MGRRLGWQASYRPTDDERSQCERSTSGDTHKSDECKNLWERTTTDPVAFFTFVLSISTIGLWFVTWRGAKNQSADTRILQRAYLAVQAGEIEISGQNQVTDRIAVINTGRLPARKVSGYANIKWAQARDTEDFPESIVPAHTYVLPVGEQSWLGTGALPQGIKVMNGQTGYVFVWGRFTYEDGFGEKRFLTFCHRYSCAAPRVTGGVNIEARQARQHHVYNDGD